LIIDFGSRSLQQDEEMMADTPQGTRTRQRARPLVEDHARLDIRRLQRSTPLLAGAVHRVLPDPGRADAGPRLVELRVDRRGVALQFVVAGAAVAQAVAFDATPCHFGRGRLWFRCPGLGTVACGRRVALLYFAPAAARFGCRHCLGLAYRSQRMSVAAQATERRRRVARRLGAPLRPLLFSRLPPRPRGMQRRTYARLRAAYVLAEVAEWLVLLVELRPALERWWRVRGSSPLLPLPALTPDAAPVRSRRAYLRQALRLLRPVRRPGRLGRVPR
jgi:hypothetical protein